MKNKFYYGKFCHTYRLTIAFAILIFGGALQTAKGQIDTTSAKNEISVIESLNKQIKTYDSVLFHYIMNGEHKPQLPSQKWTNDTSIEAYLHEIAQEEINSLKWKTGVQFNASYNYNTNMEAPDFEDGTGMYYKNRIQAGLSWNILNSGFVGKENLIQEALLKSKLRAFNTGKDALSVRYSMELHRLKELRNLVLGNLCQSQHELFRNTLVIAKQVYDMGLMKYDEFLKFENKAKFIEHQANSFNVDSVVSLKQSVFYNIFSYYQINPDSLFFYMQKSNRDIIKIQTNIELYELLAKRDVYAQKINVSPYVRYQFLDYRENKASGHNLNAGIQLGIPLSFEHKKEKKQNLIEADLARYLLSEESQHLRIILEEFMQRYNHNLAEVQKQIIQISAKKKKVLQERVRFFTQQLPNNGKEYALVLDDFFSNVIILFDKWFTLRQTFYEAQYLAGGEPPTQYATSFEFNSDLISDKNDPAMMLKLSHPMSQTDIEHIAHACWLFFKKIIYVQYDPKIPMETFRMFCKTAHRYSVKPYLCIKPADLPFFINPAKNASSLMDSIPDLVGVLFSLPETAPDTSGKIYWEILSNHLKQHNGTLAVAVQESVSPDLLEGIHSFCDHFILELKLNDHSDPVRSLLNFINNHPDITKNKATSLLFKAEDIPVNYLQIIHQALASDYTDQVIINDFTSFHNLVYYIPQLGELFRNGKKSYYINLSYFASEHDIQDFIRRVNSTYPYTITHQKAFQYSIRIEDIPNEKEQKALLMRILHSRIIFY